MLLALIQRLLALISLAVLALGAYFGWSWWDLHERLQTPGTTFVHDQDWRVWLGGALLGWSLAGRLPLALLLGRRGDDGERMKRQAGETLVTPSGARLHVERNGPAEAPVLILVHGWGLGAGIWWEARRQLAGRFQVVSYDLPGLGKSTQPTDGRYSLERFAEDLRAVVEQAAPRKVILVGHSIGGMTVQTFCRRYPDLLNTQVMGVVLENTTDVDPTHTTILGEALHALEPVLKPLMHLDIWLQPLAWLMNWQSYLSGSTHLAMRFGGFGSRPTKAQLNQVALAATRNSPAVQAKGNLAMMNWSGVADDLPRLRVPALVFIGGHDIVTVPAAGAEIARRLPQARPLPVAAAGHLGLMECAGVYNSALEAFADEIFTSGARYADARAAVAGGEQPATPSRRPGVVEPRPFS